VLDIPVQLWSDLADLFVSADSDIARRRERFARLIQKRLDGKEHTWFGGAGEFLIHTARISRHTSVNDQEFLDTVLRRLHRSAGNRRRLFLLLIRFARENDNRQLIEHLFSSRLRESDIEASGAGVLWKTILGVPPNETLETLNTESILVDLAYREAMDLNWALDVARQVKRKRGSVAKPPRSPHSLP
jgi:hypothetical protein